MNPDDAPWAEAARAARLAARALLLVFGGAGLAWALLLLWLWTA